MPIYFIVNFIVSKCYRPYNLRLLSFTVSLRPLLCRERSTAKYVKCSIGIGLTDESFNAFGNVRVRPNTSLVLSGYAKLVESVLLQLFSQLVAGARNFVLFAAVASPFRRAFDAEFDDVVEYLRSSVAATVNKGTMRKGRFPV